MAIDNTPPRLRLIVTIAIMTVITLVAIDFALQSYYGYMSTDAQRLKLAPTTALTEQHKAEQAALKSGVEPLDQAMAQLAKGSRSDLVAPKQSDDLGPMTGWSKLPKPAPTPEAHGAAALPPAGHEAVTAGDAGAPAMTGDAGAPAAAADAGAPKPGAAAKDAGAPKGAPHK